MNVTEICIIKRDKQRKPGGVYGIQIGHRR